MVFVESLFGMSRGFFVFWAYVAVGIFIFLESFPFVGAFVPGGIIALLVCGFLAKLGYFVFWKVGLVCIVALVLVDCFGYWFGRKRKRDFLHRKRKILLMKSNVVCKVQSVVHGHTGKSLILGKFNPITRSITPFIVGNERVSFVKFFVFSILGSILFVGSFLFLGFLLGVNYEVVEVAEHYILWIGGILLGSLYLFYLGNLFKEYFGRKINGNCKQE